MDKTELKEFKDILQNSGYSEHDFSLKEKDTTVYDKNAIVPITSILTIECLSTQRSHSYNSGTGTNWVVSFEKDLKNGLFD